MKIKMIGAAMMASCLLGTGAWGQTTLPDYSGTPCAVTPGELSRWFTNDRISKNAMVNPADSTAFPPAATNTTCDFYKWGAQMFLWPTSPTGGAFVFDGPMFYDVVAAAGGGLKYVVNDGATANSFGLRAEKSDQIEETGQAGGSGVLLSQQESLTYYGMSTNDVYANYLTLQKNGEFDGSQYATLKNNFPTTEAELLTIEGLSGKTFADGEALAMELKTSWVDASTVPDKSRYILINADIPSYNRSDPRLWTLNPNPDLNQELALVGMHVVATVKGHPEMVWATFEHIDNAPDASFYINDGSGANIQVPFNGNGNWLFRKSGGTEESHIVELANVNNGNIDASTSAPIGASQVVRLNPWGSLAGTAANAENNTELTGLNFSIRRPLYGVGDVRANYIQIGGIWSAEGQIPTSGTDSVLRGSLKIANATMETFHQFPDKNNGFVSDNCFTCHGTSSGKGIDTSHIFGKIAPLP